MPSRFHLNEYVLIWLALVLMGLFLRPLTPIDETRAVSVAWDMWQRGDFLVPHLNGLPYSHKPPLLQWCIHLLWALFGVSEWSARLVSPAFALGNLFLTAKLSRGLWPDDASSPRIAPLLLLANPLWALWTSLTLYDMTISFFGLLGLHGIIRAARGNAFGGWALAAIAIGGGALSKGPAILLIILPPAVCAPCWLNPKPGNGWAPWYLGMVLSILSGAAIALTWAIPASLAGGEEYGRLIFWGQTVGRINDSFAHKLPLWWYFALLPLLWLPWVVWPPLWRVATARLALDSGQRFCITQIVFVLLAFSLISGKRVHYLLPMFPAAALFAARMLGRSGSVVRRRDMTPVGLLLFGWGLALSITPQLGLDTATNDWAYIADNAPAAPILILLGLGPAMMLLRRADTLLGVRVVTLAMLGLFLSAHLIYRQAEWDANFLQPFADRLAAVQRQNLPIAHWQKYHGQFDFLGRLNTPIVEIRSKREMLDWLRLHPQGYVIIEADSDPAIARQSESGAEFTQSYRGSNSLMLWKSSRLASNPELLPRLLQ